LFDNFHRRNRATQRIAQSDILHNSCASVCIWCCVHAWLRFDDWRTNEDDRNAKWVSKRFSKVGLTNP